MAYCTQQDMIDRIGEEDLIQLTDRNQTGVIDALVLGKAIDDATDTINAYLSSRYTLPLAVVPAVLTRLCCDMARYYLYGHEAPESVNDRNNAALDLLKSIAKGQIDLAVGETSGEGGGIAFESGAAVFDETESWP